MEVDLAAVLYIGDNTSINVTNSVFVNNTLDFIARTISDKNPELVHKLPPFFLNSSHSPQVNINQIPDGNHEEES
jgi:hypothetical protein